MTHWLRTALTLIVIALFAQHLLAAEAPRIRDVRMQKVDDVIYFHLRLEPPGDLHLPVFDSSKPFSEADRRKFARLPRLIPADGKTHAVYYRYKPNQNALSFYGKVTGEDKAKLLLLYPLKEEPGKEKLALPELLRSPAMAEAPVEVDFAKARKVPVPVSDPDDLHISNDDLRGNWALYQAAYFAILETQVLDFNFYSFAREATSRKYSVVAPAWVKRQLLDPEHRLYEVTTGADAIAETLQLHRLLHPDAGDKGERTIDIANVRGITVPEQPWEKMLAGKKPSVEPIARLVPRDNYYIHFKDLRKFIDFSELLNQWGTNVTWVYEMRSRDYQLQERYEKQLCLKSTLLGKTLGPAVVKSVAVTGSDPYVREGTDVTVIFHVNNRPLFLAAVEGFLKEARAAHAGQLREGKEDYHKVTIESFVTPLREVSLHRAMLDDFVVYSNSPTGIRRIIDTHQGLRKSLAGSPDFQYMRTVFPFDDKEEEGFAFLSDAFVRQLVGPASRIKEKRRLEAQTSMYMVTNAVLFTAWETGKLPADHAAALAGAGLKPEDVTVRDGKGVVWDAKKQLAVSDVYNSIHFATPLIELPIDTITAREEKDYARFREEYTRLWSGYFDPTAMRIALDEKRIRVETHILPVVGSTTQRLLQMTGPRKASIDPIPGSAAEVLFHLDGLGAGEVSLSFHVDESALLRAIVELLIRWEADPGLDLSQEYGRAFWKLPLAVGFRLSQLQKDDLVKMLANIKTEESRYKGVSITHVKITKETTLNPGPLSEETIQALMKLAMALNGNDLPLSSIAGLMPSGQEGPAELHLVGIDKTIYIATNAEFLKRFIDQAEANKKNGEKAAGSDVNMRLHLGADKAREAASLLFEYEDHSLTLLNNQVWNCFYQTGILAPDAPARDREATVRRFLGYLPVSASGADYTLDPKLGEVANRRHGTYRQPQFHAGVEDKSDLGRFLNQLGPIRAELRSRDNALHTVLTIERK